MEQQRSGIPSFAAHGELSFELVHASEAAALACAAMLGKGDPNGVSEAAGEAMRHALEQSGLHGTVVLSPRHQTAIPEGAVITGGDRKVDLGVYPVEGASQVARGHILKAARLGEPIPEGWAVDAEGRPTTDPEAAIDGSLLPLGGDKGFALALLVEVLSGVLAGAAVGPEVAGTFTPSDRESNVGHCFLALDAEAIAPGFAARMERLAVDLRRAGGRAPGDRRHAERARRQASGIDLASELVANLEQRAGRRL